MQSAIRFAGLATVALGSLMLGGSAGAAAIVNGDFTTPNTGGGFSIGAVPGWTNDNGDTGVEVGASTLYGLPCITPGCQNMEVNANEFDTVSQTVTGLIVGDTYDLSWEYGGRNGGGAQALEASFGGVLLTTDSSDGVNSFWTLNSFEVVATSASETLTFQSLDEGGTPSYGNEITAVSLSVPEAATWALMLAGFAGLGAALRLSRRKAGVASA